MADTLLPVIDARPNRETFIWSKFLPVFGWRLIGRNNADSYGSTPVAAKGLVIPAFPADILTAGLAQEDLTGTYVNRSGGAGAGEFLDGQIYTLPRHGAFTVPAQTIIASIDLGIRAESAGTATCTSFQLELVKIAADGTVTQLATATQSATTSNGTTIYVAAKRSVSITVASDLAIADGELAGFRITTEGSPGSYGGQHCINAGGGTTAAAPALNGSESHIWMRIL